MGNYLASMRLADRLHKLKVPLFFYSVKCCSAQSNAHDQSGQCHIEWDKIALMICGFHFWSLVFSVSLKGGGGGVVHSFLCHNIPRWCYIRWKGTTLFGIRLTRGGTSLCWQFSVLLVSRPTVHLKLLSYPQMSYPYSYTRLILPFRLPSLTENTFIWWFFHFHSLWLHYYTRSLFHPGVSLMS